MRTTPDTTTIEALQDVLEGMVDLINQLFFHTHMLRAWGHSEAMARNVEWIAKMRRLYAMTTLLFGHGGRPRSRGPVDLEIGSDTRTVLESDAAQTRSLIARVERARARCRGEETCKALDELVAAERQDLTLLETWLAGPQASEASKHSKYLMPKPGAAPTSIASIDAALPPMTAVTSQITYHCMIFREEGKEAQSKRELDVAISMMYRTQALLERLLDLGGLPGGCGHGCLHIAEGEHGVDETNLASLEEIIAILEKGLEKVTYLNDPMTFTLLDGLLRAERDDVRVIRNRLAAFTG